MPVTVLPVPVLSDNYVWLLKDEVSGAVGVVDPGESVPVQKALDARGGRLDMIFLTHHHSDHTAGALALSHHYGAKIAGAAADRHRLPPLDLAVRPGDTVPFGSTSARVLGTPGHTTGHICYYFPDPPILFCGDTLFSLGCGRLFEGTPEDLFRSLREFDALPDETLVCCGHEYTESNVRFCLKEDPDNAALKLRAEEIKALRAAGKPTLPSVLGSERACNPFLRAPDVATLAHLRAAKDKA